MSANDAEDWPDSRHSRPSSPKAAPDVAVTARLTEPVSDLDAVVQAASVLHAGPRSWSRRRDALLAAASAGTRALILETSVESRAIEDGVDRLIGWARQAAAARVVPSLALTAPDASTTIRAYRLLTARLARESLASPVHLIAPIESNPYERLLRTSVALGSLLCDGIGDSVEVRGGDDPSAVRLAFNVLQATGARISKTEYVACPSCGRTLFDLQPGDGSDQDGDRPPDRRQDRDHGLLYRELATGEMADADAPATSAARLAA